MALVKYKYIYLTQGAKARVSAEDWSYLMEFKWRCCKRYNTSYAKADIVKEGEDGRSYKTTVYMHRLITRAKKGLQVDHINGKGLDCRRENLRVCTGRENMQNRRYGKSKYRGVTVIKRKDKSLGYRARIKDIFEGKQIHLGVFNDEQEAAKAYDAKARELYGEFFGLNFTREEYKLVDAMSRGVDDCSDIPF